jgi:hypothetical protein
MANGPRGTDLKRPFAIRVSDEQKDEIRRRAQLVDMAIGPYMVAAALGMDPDAPTAAMEIEEIKRRLDRLERLAELGTYE